MAEARVEKPHTQENHCYNGESDDAIESVIDVDDEHPDETGQKSKQTDHVESAHAPKEADDK